MRVLSYNIHKGFALGGRSFILNALRDAVRSTHADLVCLQEVLGDHTKHPLKFHDWPKASQFEFLADEVWEHHAYGKNAIYSSGHHGNAILSKFPLVDHRNQDISTNKRERRGLLHAHLHIPGSTRPLHVLTVHLDLFQSGRDLQLIDLCAFINKNIPADAPLIVAGDFNDWRSRASHQLQAETGLVESYERLKGKPARTFPSILPTLRLDRIYTRHVEIRSAEVLRRGDWMRLSDHLPLLTEFLVQNR